MLHQDQFSISTKGRGTYEVTDEVQQIVQRAKIEIGLCHVFVHHTSASLMLCENADPTVRHDLESFMAKVVPDGDPMYRHTLEGPDDMPAHIRSALTDVQLSIPVAGGQMTLGTWQGVYLIEHRSASRQRNVALSYIGEVAGA